MSATALTPSSTTTICSWKGTAHCHNLSVSVSVNTDAAWYHPVPKPDAEQIQSRIAFWKGMEVG
ncbi:DUF427 domain-containing protein [Sphingomonas desiccabilis]|uniref:DUF427 domain-containing protein n=1 Tax=Sphingomonas desiccabilis TaxID=429134 RepID=UPI002889AAC0|nr:DUF427 domain-containing protein [Sphingomonas desiccabilis]